MTNHLRSAVITIVCNGMFRFDIRECSFAEYKTLAPFHYRSGAPGPIDRCFAAYARTSTSAISRIPSAAAIIVYSMPPLNSAGRNIATHGEYMCIRDRRDRARRINADIRRISRVIVHPTFRSLHLASLLVARTMPIVGTRFIEASAVMGHFHPFFEHAGMTRIDLPKSESHEVRALRTAFIDAGLSHDVLLDPADARQRIESLPPRKRIALDAAIDRYFIQPRRGCFSSMTRTDLDWLLPRIAQRLGTAPAFFWWQDPVFDPAVRTPGKYHLARSKTC